MMICQSLGEQMGELFRCEDVGNYQRIRTPYLYPDGDYIDLFVKTSQSGEALTISDLGETVRWLRMQTIAMRRTPKQRQVIDDICLTHGVEFYRGMLLVRHDAAKGRDLASTVTRLAQAALRVADLWFTFRTRVFEAMTDEVADFLAEKQIPFERGEQLIGRSGRGYNVDFHVRTERRSSLVSVLSTGSRSTTRRIVEHVVATWFDLNHMRAGQEPIQFVSLFDDTLDVWADEDFRLIEEVSAVARWSAPEGFRVLLNAA